MEASERILIASFVFKGLHMKTRGLTFVACVGLLLATVPVVAHHSFSAEFDANAPVEVTGAVQKIEWLNPHVWFFMDVEDDEGDVTSWAMEMGSPNQLVRAGWTRRTMSIGDVVTVRGSRARDGSDTASTRYVVLANTGERLFTASSQRLPG